MAGLRPARSSISAAVAKPGMPPIVISVTNPTEPTVVNPCARSSTAIHEFSPKNPISAKNHSPNAIVVRAAYSRENTVASGPFAPPGAPPCPPSGAA